MQDKEPLEFEELAEYLEQPQATAHAQIRRRLLTSPLSRQRADLAWRIRQTLRENPQSVLGEVTDEAALTAEMRTQLQSLRAGELDAGHAASLRARLHADSRLMREALHCSVAQGVPRKRTARQLLGNWLRQLSHWRVPVWTAAATATALVLAVVLLMPLGGSEDDGLRLAAYRDDATIRFAAKDTLPGLGFFSDAQTETQPFAGVNVQLRGSELIMNWPDVAGAQGYTVQLLVMEAGRQREIATREVAISAATITNLRPLTGQRYVWVISGTTEDQRRFATRGGFVLQ